MNEAFFRGFMKEAGPIDWAKRRIINRAIEKKVGRGRLGQLIKKLWWATEGSGVAGQKRRLKKR